MRFTTAALILLSADPSMGAAQAETPSEADVFAAASVHPYFDDGTSIGPDARTLRYEYTERWRAAVGGELALVGMQGSPGALALTLGGLLRSTTRIRARRFPTRCSAP
ncbi:MAG TPA: hypothetical protein ENK57_05925 [Polyangiaceae bacterium]|nr:hypothetical protein [Polyangiaceae bacterium]